MKFDIFKFTAVSAAIVGLAACTAEEYVPGVQDRDDSYDVYFDAGQSVSLELGIDEEAKPIIFTLSRTVTEGDITVPIVIRGDKDLFQVTDVEFADGESTAEMAVVYEVPDFFKSYSCVFAIEDPLYAKIYGQNETSVTVTAVREDFIPYAEGMYSQPKLLRQPIPVKMYYSELTDTYQLRDLWGPGYHFPFFWEEDGTDVTPAKDVVDTGIDAGQQAPLAVTPTQGKKSSYDPSTKTFSFELRYIIPGTDMYLPMDQPDQYTITKKLN